MRSTSLEAYTNLKKAGKLGSRRRTVYETLKKYPCRTDMEIADHLGFSDPNKVRPRRNELVKRGLVIPYRVRLCTITGVAAWTWKVKEQ